MFYLFKKKKTKKKTKRNKKKNAFKKTCSMTRVKLNRSWFKKFGKVQSSTSICASFGISINII